MLRQVDIRSDCIIVNMSFTIDALTLNLLQ